MKFKRCAAGAAVLAAAAAMVAAGPNGEERATVNPFTVGCYDALDQQANTTIVAYTPGTQRLSAEELCVQEWAAQGHLGHDALVTCVVDGGGTGVFPHARGSESEACASIGAAAVAPGRYGSLTAAQVRSFSWNLGRRYESTWSSSATCSASAVLESVARDAIAKSAAQGEWTVRVAEASDCAYFTIDPVAAEVVITAG